MLARRLALAAVSILVGLLLAELAVRALALGPRRWSPRRTEPPTGQLVVVDQLGRFEYRSNITFSHHYDPAGDTRGYLGPTGRIDYRINSRRMRGPETPTTKPANSFRVVVLGDSFTFGEGVREDDAYPIVLGRLLQTRLGGRAVEPINAGVQAYGTVDEAVFFEAHALALQPDLVLVGFVLNDATDARVTISQHEDRMRAAPLSWLGRMSRIEEIVELRSVQARVQDEYFRTTRASFESERWSLCVQALRYLHELGRERGFRFGVIVWPLLYGLDGAYPFEDLHRKVLDECRRADIPALDLLPTFRGRAADSLWVHPTDQHPNEIAHRLAAEAIAHWIDEARLLQP